MSLLVVVVVSSTRLAISAECLAMAGMALARCRASMGDAEGTVVVGVSVPTPSRPPNQPIVQESQSLVA